MVSDEDAARLMPLYLDVKNLLRSISGGVGSYSHAAQLEALIESAILANGKLDKLRADISANDLLIATRLLAEKAESIKAQVDALP